MHPKVAISHTRRPFYIRKHSQPKERALSNTMIVLCRLTLVVLVLASLAAQVQPQQAQEELQSHQELADEEVSHWGVAIALLALQVGHSFLLMRICITFHGCANRSARHKT